MIFNKPGAWPALTTITLLQVLWNPNPAFSSSSSGGGSSKPPQVQWISPSAGDRFGPGDSILGKWTTDTAVVSPNFKLCPGEPKSSLSSRSEAGSGSGTGGDDNGSSDGACGSKVYPTVQQSAGTYTISLAVPNVTSEQPWHLVMSDDFDNSFPSPSFSLSPTASAPSVASAPDAQAPLSAQPQPPASTSASTPSVPASAVPSPVINPESDTAATMYATRTPPPTAAFAIPLSIVGAILLVAVFLSLKHNRKLAEERAQDVEKLVLSRKASVASTTNSSWSFKPGSGSGYSRQADIEHALNVLSRAQSQGKVKTMPVPLFMPVEVPVEVPVRKREARRSTREAYYPSRERYTEYHRRHDRDGRSYHARPPSYHTDSLSVPVSRPQSRARSLLSDYAPSGSRASSRTAVHPPSQYYYHSGRQPRSFKSSSRAASPQYSDYRSTHDYARSRYEGYEGHEDDRTECATQSVLGDYLPEHEEEEESPVVRGPPECLIPAPQRLHVRNNSAMSARSHSEEEEMTEIDLYGAVAKSLDRARRH
ncbi:hypothetical protein FB446DRAFT_727276 [Lentinula raphanica]|nr:hypothetical protein FB446DRAFT_727276 [Lentinula raphanica]